MGEVVPPILSADDVAMLPSYLALADSTHLRRSHEALRRQVETLTEAHTEACGFAWRLYCAGTAQTLDSFHGVLSNDAVTDVERFVEAQMERAEAAERENAELREAVSNLIQHPYAEWAKDAARAALGVGPTTTEPTP